DDGPVRPRAGAGSHEPVAAGLHRVPVASVGGDPGLDVLGVPGVLLPRLHVRATLSHVRQPTSLRGPGHGHAGAPPWAGSVAGVPPGMIKDTPRWRCRTCRC